MNTYKFYIQNLKCSGCASTITKNISEIKLVSNVKVDVDESSVTLDSEENRLDDVKNKLASMGYPLEDEQNSTLSKAKSYVSCMVGKISN